jgi:MFS family permease
VLGLKERLRDSAKAFQDVFRNPNLRRLELAWGSLVMGHWAYLVAVGVFAYLEGGAAAVGVLVVIRTIPAALVAPFTASLADRYSRKTVMIVSDLIRGSLVAGAAACVFLDSPAEVVYAIAGLAMIAGTPFRPALAALTPSLARTPEELTAANAVVSTLESIGRFVGPALAGVLLATWSAGVVFLLTAFTFFLSALFVGRLQIADVRERPDGAERAHFLTEAFAGFRTIAHERQLRILLTLFAASNFVAGANSVLLVVMALDLLDIGESGVGFLNAAFGVGALAGAIAALSLAGLPRLTPPFIVGVLLWGLPLASIGLLSNYPLALVALALVGVGNSVLDVTFFTLIQRTVKDEILARVFGVIHMMWILSFGLGGLLIVPVIVRFGAAEALVLAGAFLPVLVLILGRPLIRLEAAAVVPGAELSLLRSVPIFTPLSGPSIEQLASHLIPLRTDEGTVIVREGDAGDRFYVIGEGVVTFTVEGEQVSELGPGDAFGEIALIRDVPRTATATTRTSVVLYALEREDFLRAVTGHASSAQAAERVISARLASVSAAAESLSA